MFKKKHVDSQSAFSAQEPLYQQVQSVPASEQQAEAEQATQPQEPDTRPFFRKKKFVVLAIGIPLAIILLLLVLVMLQGRAGNQEGEVAPSPSATPSSQIDRGPLQQRIDRVQEELKAADPTKQVYPFPPVDTDDLTVR